MCNSDARVGCELALKSAVVAFATQAKIEAMLSSISHRVTHTAPRKEFLLRRIAAVPVPLPASTGHRELSRVRRTRAVRSRVFRHRSRPTQLLEYA